MVTVFKAEKQDISDIIRIENEVFSESPWSAEDFIKCTENDFDTLFAASCDGVIIGYAWLRVAGDAEILRIAVSAEARRKGCASELLKEIIREAKSEKAGSIFLEVRDSNAAASGLYEKAGFDRISIRKNYYKDPEEDAVIMRYLC